MSFIGDAATHYTQDRPPIGSLHVFEHISRLEPDAILGLMAQYRADPHPLKVDLGVGVFRDLNGDTPVLDCVRHAEQRVLAAQSSKSYVSAAGREEFNTGVEELVLGKEHPARLESRARTVQAPGGCGALRVGAELIRTATPAATVHVSTPTWGNHHALLGGSGMSLVRYPYYDPATHRVDFAAMLEHLDKAPAGDVVLLHACCHNPPGADLTPAQWDELIELLKRRRLVPFLDLAYQGFGDDLEGDAEGIRRVARRLPEVLIATSYSKNLGLYRERVGALIVVSATGAHAAAVHSQVLQIARSIYSMPPDHGAAIAACIFADSSLRAAWTLELTAMRRRIQQMRLLLAQHLREAGGGDAFDFIQTERGMFSLLGVPKAVVERLRDSHHIYMTQDSRMNLAGIMPQNVRYVAQSIVAAGALA
jgi:aspartate aminotransferase